ncbi:hypothetical protein JAAARDRAFT_191445 [Jaapia argillacea MUCL 33604]|uniref:Uncharacterized protein n=1 Tax=Jaapia argillacea MUCL 33604 TaxID=933084 RepID=A0A067QBP5_9AGAM|nr:hypothetical protein JAAARDRAFT_191445 [Jaapia argillacea MUCL 33604]
MADQPLDPLKALPIHPKPSTSVATQPPKQTRRQPFELRLPRPGRRIRLYGYAVPGAWLTDFGVKCLEPGAREVFHAFPLASYGLRRIKMKTRVKLTVHFGRIDAKTPPEAVVPGEGFVQILAVCTNERHSYKARPTQKQVDTLTRIFGRSPRWWVDDGPLD